MKKMRTQVQTLYGAFDVALERDDGQYLVAVVGRPDIITFGKNIAHAKRMAKEAIEVSIEGDVLMRAKHSGDIKILRMPVQLA
jgi:predicted RNase H-like HicB family nuclease